MGGLTPTLANLGVLDPGGVSGPSGRRASVSAVEANRRLVGVCLAHRSLKTEQ